MKCKFYVVQGRKFFLVFIVLILSIHSFLFFTIAEYKIVVKKLSYNLFNSFSITNNLFEEKDGNIFFVFNSNSHKQDEVMPKLILPKVSEFKLENGVITFNIDDNVIIKSAGKGFVKNIGILENGLKYVEIKHSSNIITRYENLWILGVGKNFNVSDNSVIGTLKGEPLVFKILINDEIYCDFEIESGEIIWKN